MVLDGSVIHKFHFLLANGTSLAYMRQVDSTRAILGHLSDTHKDFGLC
jgi:hypothetical protein